MAFGVIVEETLGITAFRDGPPKTGSPEHLEHVKNVDALLAEVGQLYAEEVEKAGLRSPHRNPSTGIPELFE
eukprot:gene24529-29836_t